MPDSEDYEVKLKVFEGPLDLLLHLIRKNEVDIFDIPIRTITQQYLDYLDMMKALNISVATVSTHLQRVYEKLHVTTNTGAVAKALREKLI